jgi:hypothetical protein
VIPTREDRKDPEMAEGEAKECLAAEEREETPLLVVQNEDMAKAEDKKENNPPFFWVKVCGLPRKINPRHGARTRAQNSRALMHACMQKDCIH